MRTDARIAIVGGSLVGPATEMMLKYAGFPDVTTFEASKIVLPTSGGVMGVRPQVMFDLEQMGVSMDEATALASSKVTSVDVVNGELHYRGESMFPGRVASWDQLYAAFSAHTNVQHGKRVVNLEPTKHGALLYFADKTSREFDLIVFADGRKSTGRMLLDPERRLEYQGYVVWRGLADPTIDAEGFIRHYDQPHGTLFSVTEPIIQSGQQYWEYSHNLPRDAYADMTGREPEERAFLLPNQITDRVHERLDRSMDEFGLPTSLRSPINQATSITAIPVNDLPAPTRAHWRVGGADVVLLGDALIPVRLQVGVGLNMGIRQGRALASHLAAGRSLTGWERHTLNRLAPWVELGRSRAHRSNLGSYTPVRPGRTTVPKGNVWSNPTWVMA